jgi:hypothetical protein
VNTSSVDASKRRRSQRWRLAVHLFLGALMLSIAVAGYALLGPHSDAAARLRPRPADVATNAPQISRPLALTSVPAQSGSTNASTVFGPASSDGTRPTTGMPATAASDPATLMGQVEALSRTLQSMLAQAQRGQTLTPAGHPASVASQPPDALSPPMFANPGAPRVGAPLTEPVGEMQQLYRIMGRLIERLNAPLNGLASPGELGAIRVQMDDITRRMNALMAQHVDASAVEFATLSADIADLVRRVDAIMAPNANPAPGELAALSARLDDITRRMEVLMALKTDPLVELSALVVQLDDIMRRMDVMMARNDNPSAGELATMSAQIDDLTGRTDALLTQLQAGPAGLSPGSNGTPGVGSSGIATPTLQVSPDQMIGQIQDLQTQLQETLKLAHDMLQGGSSP